jgi:hypothetical protein
MPRGEQLKKIEYVRAKLGNKAAKMVAWEYRIANIKRAVSNFWRKIRGH